MRPDNLQEYDRYDLYYVLEVTPEATQEQIKKAFRKKALEHHPDKHGDHEIFSQIQLAHEILTNSEKKELYDEALKNGLRGDELHDAINRISVYIDTADSAILSDRSVIKIPGSPITVDLNIKEGLVTIRVNLNGSLIPAEKIMNSIVSAISDEIILSKEDISSMSCSFKIHYDSKDKISNSEYHQALGYSIQQAIKKLITESQVVSVKSSGIKLKVSLQLDLIPGIDSAKMIDIDSKIIEKLNGTGYFRDIVSHESVLDLSLNSKYMNAREKLIRDVTKMINGVIDEVMQPQDHTRSHP